VPSTAFNISPDLTPAALAGEPGANPAQMSLLLRVNHKMPKPALKKTDIRGHRARQKKFRGKRLGRGANLWRYFDDFVMFRKINPPYSFFSYLGV
jgi:hypothetical protein